MIFRGLDENGDWEFGRGVNDYTTQDRAILLNIKTRLQSWLGDCFFAQDEGVDYANLLSKIGQRNTLELQLKTTIIESEDVTKLVSFNFSESERKLTADFTINTIYGENISDNITIGI